LTGPAAQAAERLAAALSWVAVGRLPLDAAAVAADDLLAVATGRAEPGQPWRSRFPSAPAATPVLPNLPPSILLDLTAVEHLPAATGLVHAVVLALLWSGDAVAAGDLAARRATHARAIDDDGGWAAAVADLDFVTAQAVVAPGRYPPVEGHVAPLCALPRWASRCQILADLATPLGTALVAEAIDRCDLGWYMGLAARIEVLPQDDPLRIAWAQDAERLAGHVNHGIAMVQQDDLRCRAPHIRIAKGRRDSGPASGLA
jgi:hypothetical protein